MAFRFSKAILGSLIFFLMVVSAFAKNRADELNRLNDDEFRQPVDKVYLVQTTVGALPAKVFAMDPRIKKARARTNYIITVGMVNDNITPSNMPGDGDDRGLTFGYFVKINRLTSNGMMLTVSYSEDLYTKDTSRTVKKNNRYYGKQQSETESVLELLLDNSNQGRTFFYAVGVGWQRLDPSGKTAAASIQQKWHKLTNLSRQVTNERGAVNDEGFFVDAVGGFQHSGTFGPLKTHVQGSIGVRESQVEGASYYTGNVEASAQYDYESGRSTRFIFGDTERVHDKGGEHTAYLRLEAVGKHFTCGFGVSQTSGDVMNYQVYNLPNKKDGRMDLISSTYCQKRF